MRAAYDLSPLYRSLIGAEHMAALMDSAARRDPHDYPPYDIERTADDAWRISLATAGFRSDELEILAQPNLLIVRGQKEQGKAEAGTSVHRGLALRPFEQRFELADHVVITDASYADGVLTIDLVRETPEALKPRRIEINARRASPLASLIERKRRRTRAA